MFEAILLFVISLMPSLIYLWVMRKAEAEVRARLRQAMEVRYSSPQQRLPRIQQHPEQQYIEGIGYLVGDISCRYNARSAYVRCAVNPFGPCEGCSQYESR